MVLGFVRTRLDTNEMFFFIGLVFFVAVALVWKANLLAHREQIEALAGDHPQRLSPDFVPR